jgi:hypothetical protein
MIMTNQWAPVSDNWTRKKGLTAELSNSQLRKLDWSFSLLTDEE